MRMVCDRVLLREIYLSNDRGFFQVFAWRDLATTSSNPRHVCHTCVATAALHSFKISLIPLSLSLFSKIAGACKKMASGGQDFPPKTQERLPGKEHAMDPTPDAFSADYKPANKLRGKTALVTGGDSGIGRAVCLHFAAEGATVAFTYVKPDEQKDADETLRLINQHKADGAREPIAIATADVGYEENCHKVVKEAASHFGGAIDILVNNAAEQYYPCDVTEISDEQLESVFRTNVFSYFFMTKFAVNHMKEGGSIINTTSVTAYRGSKKLLDYTATKAAIVGFTRSLALQMVEKGIRVNAVAPGPGWTRLIPGSFSEVMVTEFGKAVPMRRAAQPTEIAPSYVFLACREDSSYITGQVIHPNGGEIVNG
ncbi:Glucose and ribitol dehydrogenase [Apostasia shenzhenica]|uniref:Noroxomaritidine/norcraugsodine reductase n=1 Tax=Apostasia shenzhenica TaxID=1088818 RepID=A0A2I0BA86_9ASPA|nr:Glucose and ribitol dehydrogenase [Apostasia shenzhenica]